MQCQVHPDIYSQLFFFFQATVAEKNSLLIEKDPHALVPSYSGCRDEALKKFIQSGLLQQELNKSADFKEAWTTSKVCSKGIPGKLKEHASALMVLEEEGGNFLKVFNKAFETLSVNATAYEDQFQFKSFYFLLMDLMVPLSQCKTGFMSAGHGAKKGSSVRFKSFAKVEKDFSLLQDLDGRFLLNITSCFLGAYGCNSEGTLILSPAEVFLVEDVKSMSDDNNGDYTMIVLKHQSVETSDHCSMISR